jgi:hypothetical protein
MSESPQNGTSWMLVHALEDLAHARYLGELSDPPSGERGPDDQGDVGVEDWAGVKRSILLVVDGTRTRSMFTGRRSAGSRSRDGAARSSEGPPSKPTRREGEAALLSPVLTAAGPATGTDGRPSVAGSGRRFTAA